MNKGFLFVFQMLIIVHHFSPHQQIYLFLFSSHAVQSLFYYKHVALMQLLGNVLILDSHFRQLDV